MEINPEPSTVYSVTPEALFVKIGRLVIENELLRSALSAAEVRASEQEAIAANLRSALLARNEGRVPGPEVNETAG